MSSSKRSKTTANKNNNNNNVHYDISEYSMKPFEFCDFVINLNGISIKSHKAILCNASKYFSNILLNSDFKENKPNESSSSVTINLNDLSSDFTGSTQNFIEFLDYLYNTEKSIYFVNPEEDSKLLKPQYHFNLNDKVEVNGWGGDLITFWPAKIIQILPNKPKPYKIRFTDGSEQLCKEENVREPIESTEEDFEEYGDEPNNAAAEIQESLLSPEQKDLYNSRLQYCENLLHLTGYFGVQSVEARVQRFLIKMLYRDNTQMWRLLLIAEKFHLPRLTSHCMAAIVKDPQRNKRMESNDYLTKLSKETLIQLCNGLSKIDVAGIVPVDDEDLYHN